MKRILAILLTAALLCGMSLNSLAASGTIVPVTWSDLHIDAGGSLSWKLQLPAEYSHLQVQKYTISMEIMTTGGTWANAVKKTYNCVDSSKELNYSLVGIYRFRVMATFVGGYQTEYSGYSPECTVTKDYINQGGGESSGGPGTTGPGTSSGTTVISGTSSGPGVSSKTSNDVPDWAEKTGMWYQENGNWYYVNNGVLYKNKWACIYNPYAKTGLGQRSYDWFSFDENGAMRTGWYTDSSGNTFYLNPAADGSKGKMATGWTQIDGYWYYFYEQEATGYMGAMVRNATVDGHKIDAQGRRVS